LAGNALFPQRLLLPPNIVLGHRILHRPQKEGAREEGGRFEMSKGCG